MLMRESIRDSVIEIIAKQLNLQPDKITESDTFDKLAADSLDRVEIVMNLEEKFGIEINDADVEKVQSVSQVIDYVSEKLSAKK